MQGVKRENGVCLSLFFPPYPTLLCVSWRHLVSICLSGRVLQVTWKAQPLTILTSYKTKIQRLTVIRRMNKLPWERPLIGHKEVMVNDWSHSWIEQGQQPEPLELVSEGQTRALDLTSRLRS